MTEKLAWVIEMPPKPNPATRPKANSELEALARAWKLSAGYRSLYTPSEMAAIEDPAAVDSWVADKPQMFGPLTILARAHESGRIVAGVELWQQKRDHYWLLADLVRDQAAEYKGAGREVVDAARGWWAINLQRRGWPLRVYAMAREVGAVGWWSDYLQRPGDLVGELKAGDYVFPAVGWVIGSA
jgi:hypothetical protein